MFLLDSLRSSIGKASPFALHIFLIVGVVVYTVFGALIIKYLEAPERVRAAKAKRSEDERPSVDISKWTGVELAQMDPKVHECVLLAVVDIFSKAGCDDDSALDQAAITALDDCYREAEVPALGRLSLTTPEHTSEDEALDEEVRAELSKWSFENAVIFSFTVITTVGYGHIVPATTYGRVFVIVYGLIGVPLTLLTIADLGMFIAKALHLSLRGFKIMMGYFGKNMLTPREKDSPKEKKIEESKEEECSQENPEDEIEPRKVDETVALCVLFAVYILGGAYVLSSYEPEMGFFEAFYFNFVTLTTIGLGDFVPKSYDYLFITLCYIGIGLALTTMAVEIMADGLRKIHYFGRTISAKGVTVWFGGEKIRLDRLIKNLGEQFNVPEEDLLNFKVDNFVEQAIKVEQGEIQTLRKPVVLRENPLSYSNLRKSDESAALRYVDSTRSARPGTVGLPPLAFETSRLDSMEREDYSSMRVPRRRIDPLEERRAMMKVRFSEGSFAASETTNSMNYSDEDLPTLREEM